MPEYSTGWRLGADVLGSSFDVLDLPMADDYEGPVVVRLVRYGPADDHADRAVLWLHGYADYFFHTHVAEEFARGGYAFYALDLRRYGRSLLPHQTPNFCRSVQEYYADIDAAVDAIRSDGRSGLTILAHSTGALVASAWAGEEGPRTGFVRGLALNSPFLALPVHVKNAALRTAAETAIRALGRWQPYRALPRGGVRMYGPSLHVDAYGEWSYDLRWKPHESIPIRAGWLAAVIAAQRRLAGRTPRIPVLTMTSARSNRLAGWSEELAHSDLVLDVESVRAAAQIFGPTVQHLIVERGRHDLLLSERDVREGVMSDLRRWMDSLAW
jgi:alpha-beta hydrolase superfamily lysophospholipase